MILRPRGLLSPTRDYVCCSCRRKLSVTTRRRFSSTSHRAIEASSVIADRSAGSIFNKYYFSSNNTWSGLKPGFSSTPWQSLISGSSNRFVTSPATAQAVHNTENVSQDTVSDNVLPHRRRRRRRESEEQSDEYVIPLDASSQLSSRSSTLPKASFKQKSFAYLALSKPRLTFLMVLTSAAAFSLYPVAVSPMSSSLNLSPMTLMNLTAGTALSSACANALNMLLEPEHDAKMSRTRGRPLVRGLLTKRAALGFAAVTGTAGVALLYFGVNPTVSFLSALNVFLYAGVYTPLKRLHPVNTWAGAVVGAIPPLMGWAAGAGQALANQGIEAGWYDLLFDPMTSAGGWLFAALLFAWQFPHFNAIAHTIRHEYANAGYKMLASTNPRKNALIGLRYSILMFPICAGLSYVGVTGWTFVATSGIVNSWMLREAWRFWRFEGEKGSARGLFWASVWQLPLILVLAMIHKKGLWDRVFWGGLDDEDFEEFRQEKIEEQRSRKQLALTK